MSTLVKDELIALLKESSSSSSEDGVQFEKMVDDCGLTDYLTSIISEAANADDVSLAVDVDGLKEVIDSFLPPLASLSREQFSDWFDSLLAKRLAEDKKSTPVEENVPFMPKTAPVQRQRTWSLQENEVQAESKEELIKKQMIEKFSYVAADEYQKTHKPHVAFDEVKKMTRFRNNKVVSTKGDRYAVEKSPESEEMKGTYVHIKQLRRFKFH